jgi:hypothetical protein
MTARHAWSPALVVGLATLASPALAGNSGALRNLSVSGSFYFRLQWQSPGVTLTITTSNLSPGSDTVIHVQDDLMNFVAGNDDYAGLASRVVVPPAAYSRPLYIIIRSYSQSSAGSCTVTTTPSSGSPIVETTTFGGQGHYLGTLAAGSYISTVERQGGASDTVMLAIGGSASNAVTFDDDAGVDRMSSLHLPVACDNCLVVVANYSASAPLGGMDLIWDEDADTADPDNDGMGNSLESFLGTSSTSDDTDQDGLRDDFEVYGTGYYYADSVKFPTWGADPTQKDLFMEADWIPCSQPDNAAVCPAGLDTWKFGSGWGQQVLPLAAGLKQAFLPVRVHLDVPMTNSDPTTWHDWGNWGQANMVSGTQDACAGLGASRGGLFHHIFSGIPYGSCLAVPCHGIGPSAYTVMHEVGHGLGLRHGGRPHKIDMLKPNYVSQMNYFYGNNPNVPGFSHGNFSVQTLNPTALDEQLGLGASPPGFVLDSLNSNLCLGASTYQNGAWVNSCVQGTSIDWNRDGVFQASGTVRAVIARDASMYARTNFSEGSLHDPAMTWVSPAAGNDQLWIFGRRASDGQLQWVRRGRSSLEAGCGYFPVLNDHPYCGFDPVPWVNDCAGFGTAVTDWPGSKSVAYAPGVVEYNGTILVVSQLSSGQLVSNQVFINQITDQVTYGADVILPGGFSATGDISALAIAPGVVAAYVPWNGNLLEFRFQNGSWTYRGASIWADASNVRVSSGIAATVGFQDGSPTPRVYAAIPTEPNGQVEFARQEADGQWTKLPIWSGQPGAIGVAPAVKARPGLAYQPFAGQPSHVGRFYVALKLTDACPQLLKNDGYGCEPRVLMTEGNNTAGTSRRLLWINPSFALGLGLDASMRGVSLIRDLTRDTNVRGLTIFFADGWKTTFLPFADGIMNANASDMDDYPYIQGMLRKSLNPAAEPWPAWLP